jgi:hypothetical protein
MRAAKLATLKFFSLLFLLPGLAGLIISAMISTHYVDTLPKWSTPEESRIIPRNINGTVVYQTPAEDQKLSLIEDSSVGVFVIGLGLGLYYLEQWGSARATASDEEEALAE